MLGLNISFGLGFAEETATLSKLQILGGELLKNELGIFLFVRRQKQCANCVNLE